MSLTPDTFDGLVSAIKALAEDDSTEFENYIPTAIHLAESNIHRKLDTNGFKTQTSVVAVAGQNTLTKPTDLRFTRKIKFKTSAGTYIQPEMRTNDFLEDYWPVGETSTSAYPFGEPKYYAEQDKDTYLLAPTPVSGFTFTVEYDRELVHLSAGNQTNYLTSHVPDALFYGTMAGMAEFMKSYDTLPIWQGRYVDALEGFNNEGRRNRRDDNKLPRVKNAGENTLTGEN